MIKEPLVVRELTAQEIQQAIKIAVGLEHDLGETVAAAFTAANELKIELCIAATGVSLAGLMLAAYLHAGNEASFLAMASRALALYRTGKQMQ